MDLLREIAAERRAIADMLEPLTEAQWATPSLCEGWAVRHVVAHLDMAFRYSIPKIAIKMIKARGDFNKVADAIAKQDGKLPTTELVDCLRRNADHRFKPPGADYDAPLSDNIVHSLDIAYPLGITRTIPAERMRVVLDTATTAKARKFYGNDVSGVNFTATDVDWTFGTGPAVRGSAQDVLLVLAGRHIDLGQLEGEGVSLLSARR
jgi:uncharacterized protein (TIGR03083 family)